MALDETLHAGDGPALTCIRAYFVRLRDYVAGDNFARGCLIGNISGEVTAVSEATVRRIIDRGGPGAAAAGVAALPGSPLPADADDVDVLRELRVGSVPADEPPDTVIKVWMVTPEPSGDHFDHFLIRGWADMLEFVKDRTEKVLEGMDDVELKDGVTVSVQLVERTRGEMDELDTD